MFLTLFNLFTSFFNGKESSIDNLVFRLHYQVTFVILMFFSFLQSLTQFFGKPIDCDINPTSETTAKETFQTFCWMQGTYTIVQYSNGMPEERTRHAWYQWVMIALFIQAFACVIPHLIWRTLEGGRVDVLVGKIPRITLDSNTDELIWYRLVSASHEILVNLLNIANLPTILYFFLERNWWIILKDILLTTNHMPRTLLPVNS